MTKFCSGFIVSEDDLDADVPVPLEGKWFRIGFQSRGDLRLGGGLLVVLDTKTRDLAQAACHLIAVSSCLLNGVPLFDPREIWVQPIDELGAADQPPGSVYDIQSRDIFTMCQIAARASEEDYLIYSLMKFYLSCELHSAHWVDLDPTLATEIMKPSVYPIDHVAFANAIIVAYSVIEELGMQIPASEKKPSRIKGEWNPVVKAEIEKRLRSAGINLDDPVIWMRRGQLTPLEVRRPISSTGLPPWSRESGGVRDAETTLIDAIGHVSWLRSKIASHKLDRDASSLSPYDVSNAQWVARRLLLEHMGFWPPR